MNGILNVLKPPGMTSHDVVSYVRRQYGLKKVGHAGTLDPAAAGVLPIFLGQATRLIEYTTDASKSYRTEITFGCETDTGDDTGKPIQIGSSYIPDWQQLEDILALFTGTIMQTPPMYSAIKVGGEKLYELARAGITIEPPPRQVTIHSIRLLHREESRILIDVDCSKGTYIRTLCQDIGRRISCPATMSFLVRTRVGSFALAQAKTVEEIAVAKEKALLPVDYAIDYLPAVVLDSAKSMAIQQGKTFVYPNCPSGLVRLYNTNQTLLGIGHYDSSSSILKSVKILSSFQIGPK